MAGLYKTKRHKDDVRESTAITAVRGKSVAPRVDQTVPANQTVKTPHGQSPVTHRHSSQKAEAQ
jgi:hypothetical protein